MTWSTSSLIMLEWGLALGDCRHRLAIVCILLLNFCRISSPVSPSLGSSTPERCHPEDVLLHIKSFGLKWPAAVCVCVLLLQDPLQSCARGGRCSCWACRALGQVRERGCPGLPLRSQSVAVEGGGPGARRVEAVSWRY